MSSVNPYNCIAHTFWDLYDDLKAGNHSEYWLKGGRGSTKSSCLSICIIVGLLRDPDANAIVYRRTGNTLKDSVYGQIVWAIDELGLSKYFKCKLTPLEIIYQPTGQRILFRGTDDPMKSKSIKLQRGYFKFLWFEELAEFRGMNDIRIIRQSIFRGVDRAFTLYSYNPPKSANNWVNQEALLPVPDRLVHTSTYLDVPEDWLKKEFISQAEALKAVNERAYRNEYLGEVTGTGGQVFDNLELRTILQSEIDTCGQFYNGLDFGFAVDPDAFVRLAYDKKHHFLYFIDEFYGSHNTTDRLASEVGKRIGKEVVMCDSAEPRMIAELRRRSITALGVRKGAGSVDHGMRWLQDLGKIIIDPKRTPNAAREFASYEYMRDRDGNCVAAYPDADNHTIDSTRYALENVIDYKVAKTRSDFY